MKQRNYTETVIDPVKKSSKKIKIATKSLTLDEIENKMIELAATETNDVLTLMMNEKKIAMLEKVANIKMHRLQLKALEQSNEPVEVQPIEVKFISSRTSDNLNRLEQIENGVKESLGIKQDA